VPFPPLDSEARRQLWRTELLAAGVALDDRGLDVLAERYRLTASQIAEAVRSVDNHARWTADPVRTADLVAAARAQSGYELSALARKVDHPYSWNDLVVPSDARRQLHELRGWLAHRRQVLNDWGFARALPLGKGVCALFAGPSGTGKTMAAGVVAADLGLDLYKIDLATVVSKYVGETEKNLERIFAAAENANAVLLFDEAEAIFGKRSAVRDAHDRYANIEIAYLLQRMEEYDGIAILATNLRDHLDDAFLRRLQFIIDFPVPDECQRERMWRQFIPAAAPVDKSVDYPFLARQFRLTGGNIKNIVVSAAYLASANGGQIDMVHLLRASWREHQKIGRVMARDDLGDYAPMLLPRDADSDGTA
jgi:SpoVK/Ycf46/Vps4 family AAA+-type ATPase